MREEPSRKLANLEYVPLVYGRVFGAVVISDNTTDFYSGYEACNPRYPKQNPQFSTGFLMNPDFEKMFKDGAHR